MIIITKIGFVRRQFVHVKSGMMIEKACKWFIALWPDGNVVFVVGGFGEIDEQRTWNEFVRQVDEYSDQTEEG